MTGPSLNRRLMLGATLWIAIALVVTGFVLTGLFRNHVEINFDKEMHDQLEELLALAGVNETGNAVLTRHPAEPRYNRPLSGWYWEILTLGEPVDKSRSLWDQKITTPAQLSRESETAFYITGPRNQSLRAMARTYTLPDARAPVTILVAGPADDIERATRDFAGILAIALSLLGIGLMAAAFLQVRFGIRPLIQMREELAQVRAGRATRMIGPFAAEIEPLADELNGLLDHNTEILERARTQAGNLAHALKTPLAVLLNEANHVKGEVADSIRHEAAMMNDQINRHLSKARAAGSRGVLGVRADLGETTLALQRTLMRIHDKKNIEITVHGVEGLSFQGERQDLEEMLGNLMDNACKWATSQVRVDGRQEGQWLLLSIEDDGPGIPETALSDVIDRGRRLDETTPGSGLGLSIVRDVAELYEGKLDLSHSTLGGLAARLKLPAG
ncbi:MAG: sensor histidine kinase [Rhodospirillaceae bacterium]|nr:sensor histidine kinase [Rhodospirillaceae bacterium]MBL6930146.1 sensor histidine kinase [Rhodospirillales bacterium]MBL6940830.1 sensor histidine kinase [Rhodospirillales bacterium]